MNISLFFEGTGQGVEGCVTNVTRLRDLCVEDSEQRLHLESGPGTHFGAYAVGAIHGIGWRQIVRRADKWLASAIAGMKDVKIFLFGFSRGALIARHFAAELAPRGFTVDYLGLWDTVDATVNLDVAAECPANVARARHAVARDERRRYFAAVPLAPSSSLDPAERRNQVRELVFPGSHSDVGGLYEDNHVIADATLAWIAAGAREAGLRFKSYAFLRKRRDYRSAVIHDSTDEASNLWGALAPVSRAISHLRHHAACKLLPQPE